MQHLFVRLQDVGQLKQEMLLKDSGAIKLKKKKAQKYHLSSSCEMKQHKNESHL